MTITRHGTASERVAATLQAITDADRPEVWISRFDPDELASQAASIDARVAAGADLPLAGLVFAVKDNIDVAGLPTTAACPSFSYLPTDSAPVVADLVDAGAIVIGKTNLDQFATGLVGVRSPYGAVRNALDAELVSGGSSSGSAVAVALGLVDFALGTDTAGSGRVPAGFNHIIGVKPTLGLISSRGVVPACRSYDTVSVFAPDLVIASRVTSVATRSDEQDPRSRVVPPTAPLGAPSSPTLAVPVAGNLGMLDPAVRTDFDAACARLETLGGRIVEVDLSPLLEAARLLYDGAIVAERAEAFGAFASAHPGELDPTVEGIVTHAARVAGPDVIADQHRLLAARLDAARLFDGVDALVVPTAPIHPTIAAVEADPIGLNTTIGTFTNFVNLLDLAALSVPGLPETRHTTDGITLIVPAFHDAVALGLAARLLGEDPNDFVSGGVEVAVFGAHMRGMPLSPQLEQLGAQFAGPVHTASDYRLLALEGQVPRPAVVPASDRPGASIEGELWRVPRAAVAELVLGVFQPPLTLGSVRLDDGRLVLGCVGYGAQGRDITEHGGWRAWLSAQG